MTALGIERKRRQVIKEGWVFRARGDESLLDVFKHADVRLQNLLDREGDSVTVG